MNRKKRKKKLNNDGYSISSELVRSLNNNNLSSYFSTLFINRVNFTEEGDGTCYRLEWQCCEWTEIFGSPVWCTDWCDVEVPYPCLKTRNGILIASLEVVSPLWLEIQLKETFSSNNSSLEQLVYSCLNNLQIHNNITQELYLAVGRRLTVRRFESGYYSRELNKISNKYKVALRNCLANKGISQQWIDTILNNFQFRFRIVFEPTSEWDYDEWL